MWRFCYPTYLHVIASRADSLDRTGRSLILLSLCAALLTFDTKLESVVYLSTKAILIPCLPSFAVAEENEVSWGAGWDHCMNQIIKAANISMQKRLFNPGGRPRRRRNTRSCKFLEKKKKKRVGRIWEAAWSFLFPHERSLCSSLLDGAFLQSSEWNSWCRRGKELLSQWNGLTFFDVL